MMGFLLSLLVAVFTPCPDHAETAWIEADPAHPGQVRAVCGDADGNPLP